MCTTSSGSSHTTILIAFIVLAIASSMLMPLASANTQPYSRDKAGQDLVKWIKKAGEQRDNILRNVTFPPKPILTDSPGDDTILFFLGMAAGFESVVGNLTGCVEDGQYTYIFFKKGFKQMVKAMETGDEQLMESALTEWSSGILGIAKIMNICGLTNMDKEIRYLITVVNNQGWMELLIIEATNIGLNLGPLTQDIQIFYFSIVNQDWWNAGIAMGTVMGVLFMV